MITIALGVVLGLLLYRVAIFLLGRFWAVFVPLLKRGKPIIKPLVLAAGAFLVVFLVALIVNAVLSPNAAAVVVLIPIAAYLGARFIRWWRAEDVAAENRKRWRQHWSNR
jgi:hypothetical protein